MSGLKGRIDKLFAGTMSHVTSKISVCKDEQVIKQKSIGNNTQKVIEIVVRL
jgi:hypothetical protein